MSLGFMVWLTTLIVCMSVLDGKAQEMLHLRLATTG